MPKRIPRELDPAEFWIKVNKHSGLFCPTARTQCWLWTGSLFKAGYGAFWHPTSLQMVRAHRIAHALRLGPIPYGLLVCHTCDRRHCVRHTFLGTPSENTLDMMRKGRWVKGAYGGGYGDAHHGTKIKDAQIAEIRRAYSEDSSRGAQSRLAEMYSVTRGYISQVLHGGMRK
jgi:hypothetical protein